MRHCGNCHRNLLSGEKRGESIFQEGTRSRQEKRVIPDKMLLLLIYVTTSAALLDFLLQRLSFVLSLIFLSLPFHSTFPLLFLFSLALSFSLPSACIVRVFPALKPFPLHFSLPHGDKLYAPSGAGLLQANKCLIELFTALS